MIEIKNHRGVRDGKPLDFKRSPNGKGKIEAVAIVLHDTASPLDQRGPINWLTDPDSGVSAHVVVGRDGKVTQLVPFNERANHAGESKLDGRVGCNGFTVGIEIVNPGAMQVTADGTFVGIRRYRDGDKDPEGGGVVHLAKMPADAGHGAGGWMAYTDEQIDAVTDLCRALVRAYPTIRKIVTHWIVSPGRKVDTNPLFPLEAVRSAVFGGLETPRLAQPKPEFVADATVTASSLNLRAMPSTDAAIIAGLPRGTRVDVQEANRETGWLRIIVVGGGAKIAGKTGWVSGSFVQMDA